MLQVPGDVAFSALFSVMILIFYCRTWMAALVKCRNFSCPSFPDVRNFHHKVVPKRIANTIHFRAANETKLHIKSLIPNHFLLYWKKEMNFLVSVRYTSKKQLFTSVLVKLVVIYHATSWHSKFTSLFTFPSWIVVNGS